MDPRPSPKADQLIACKQPGSQCLLHTAPAALLKAFLALAGMAVSMEANQQLAYQAAFNKYLQPSLPSSARGLPLTLTPSRQAVIKQLLPPIRQAGINQTLPTPTR
uniref:Uncharacterized protein n=1 Tax=Bionectria ochroleuca TaxID=29856 RepID=A0A8H7KAM6_BIOOC